MSNPSLLSKRGLLRCAVFFCVATWGLCSQLSYGYENEKNTNHKHLIMFLLPEESLNDHTTSTLRYTIIIDAGSSGSRVYIYGSEMQKYANLSKINLLKTKKIKPGISTFGKNRDEILKDEVQDHVSELMEQANTFFRSHKINLENSNRIPVYFLATAGMRLQREADQERILQEVREYFHNHPSFDLKMAQILSGPYEGLYSWLAVNYLDDHFDPNQTREGILEMGGASTQITFLANSDVADNSISRNIRGKTYKIFSKSYLNLGQDQARELVGMKSCMPCQENPTCKPNERFHQCAADILTKFQSHCTTHGNDACLFSNEFEPQVEGDFVAVSAFYYILNGLEEPIRLTELESKGVEFCSLERLKTQFPKTASKYLINYCFNAAYFWNLLGKGYRFNDDHVTLATKNEINGVKISWTLGALLDIELGHVPQAIHPDKSQSLEGNVRPIQ